MDDVEKAVSSIKEKIGEENAALVSDELATVLSSSKAASEQMEDYAKTVETLKSDKENLVNANAKLFQRLGFEDKNHENAPSVTTDNSSDVSSLTIKDIINDKGDII